MDTGDDIAERRSEEGFGGEVGEAGGTAVREYVGVEASEEFGCVSVCFVVVAAFGNGDRERAFREDGCAEYAWTASCQRVFRAIFVQSLMVFGNLHHETRTHRQGSRLDAFGCSHHVLKRFVVMSSGFEFTLHALNGTMWSVQGDL